MRLVAASAGGYPRIGEKPEQQRLRRAYARLEKGTIAKTEYRAIQDDVAREAIAEQEAAGLDLVTDGQVRWYDPISHVAGTFAGIEIDGLLRFFDTNFYFRRPVVNGPIAWNGPAVRPEYEFAGKVARKPVKPVLTGPYTLAKCSVVKDEGYRRDFRRLVLDYAAALARETRELASAGARIVQIDEPAILRHPEDFEHLRGGISVLAGARGGARLALYAYFGDAAPLYDRLLSLPVDLLGLDFTYGKTADAVLSAGSPIPLGLGLFDGRNTRLEDEAEVLKTLDRLLPKVVAAECHLNPSCGVDYLPRDRARRKLERVASVARRFNGHR